jgi:hypothetical protein
VEAARADDALPQPHDIVVIGASAGGVEALSAIAAALPDRLDAAVFVVLHMAPGSTSFLASKRTPPSWRSGAPCEVSEGVFVFAFVSAPALRFHRCTARLLPVPPEVVGVCGPATYRSSP